MKVNPLLILASPTTTAGNALALDSASVTTGKYIVMVVESIILVAFMMLTIAAARRAAQKKRSLGMVAATILTDCTCYV